MREYRSVSLVALLLGVFGGSAQAAFVPFDLTSWTVEQYTTGGTVDQIWQLDGTTFAETTKKSGRSSMLLSDFTVDHTTTFGLQGTIQVNDTDDDQIGVVWGHQDRGDFYLFQWKKGPGIVADQGMHVRKLTAGAADPTEMELEGLDVPGDNSTLFADNNEEWFDETTSGIVYEWSLFFLPTGFRFLVTETIGGSATLLDVAVNDLAFTSGNFGFYNASQRNARYSAGFLIPVPTAGLLFASALGLLGWFRRKLS